MSVIWRKLWADLWNNKVRTSLVVLSIAVGVFAIGVTFGMIDQMLGVMDASHQAGVPAHITMDLTQNVDRDFVDRLKRLDGIENIALGSHTTIRYKVRPDDDWQSGWLIMREDFEEQLYSLIPLQAGEWPNRGRVGIERLSSQDLDLSIGDTVWFEQANRPRPRQINGVLWYRVVGPPSIGAPVVFFTDSAGMEAFGLPTGEYNQLLVRVTPYSEELAQQVASDIKNRLSKENIGVAGTSYDDPEKHFAQPIIGGINMVLQVLAAASLLASVVLVFNTLMAVIMQQTNQIGILKAIGGTQAQIARLYLSGVVIYGLLSLLIAMPLGAVSAYHLSKFLLNMINIDYEQFQYSPQALLLQTIAAMAVPMLAALWPILHGTAITVRQAIASYGLGGDFGSSRLDRLVEQVGQHLLSSPYVMALGNLFRRKGRLLLTQAVLVVAGVMFLAVNSLSTSIDQTLNNIFARNGYDLVLSFKNDERVERLIAVVGSHPDVEHAEVWLTHSASILREGQHLKEVGQGAELIGLPNGSTIFRPDLMVAGRWLIPTDGRAIVISKDNAEDNRIQVGDTVTLDLGELGDDEWQVIGIYQSALSDLGGGEIDPVYANRKAVVGATHRYNQGNQLYVRTRSPTEADTEAVANQLAGLYEAKKIDVSDTQTIYQNRNDVDTQLGMVVIMLAVLAVLMALVGGIGLMGALSISVVERTREIGVMRAIGARTTTILGMFVMEGVLQGLFSWLLAMPLSFILGHPLANALGTILFEAALDYQYNFGAVLTWLVIVLAISVLASILPARNATIISVRDSLAYA
jgi:putative ABC transport system permease protein